MKQLLIIFIILAIASCKNQAQNKTSNILEAKNLIKLSVKNKVEIDFARNKDLLDIILLLPEKSFWTWEWKLKDRVKWYNEIKDNNYYTDNNPDFFRQEYFEPNKAGFSIIDGFWSINIYKTAENSYVVIVNNTIGDGNSLNVYEVKSNIVNEYFDDKAIFSDFKELLKKEGTKGCNEKTAELDNPIFEFHFENENKIEIESSWYITEDSYSSCLIGNAIVYNFNPQTKRFEIDKIYWKPKQND